MSVTRMEWPTLLALPDELDDGDAATELDDLLAQVATPTGRSPLAEAAWAVSTAPSLMVALELLEAWSPADEAKHPRWPKGTPGGLAGKFMKTGQRFSIKGVEYDVAFTAPGGVYAHVATKGNIGAAQTVFIPAAKATEAGTGHTVLAGVSRPKVDVQGYKNAAHNQTSQLKATVIDPYVQADHDSSIPLPADAPPGMTAERWQRFGRADQLRYVDLMHQFGKWGDSKAQTLVNTELAKKPSDLVTFVKQAYKSQFGSSSGFSIGMLQTFSKWFQGGHAPTEAQLEGDRKKYEEAKQTQDAAARVIQWDLYNRVKAPDISVFHKSGDSVGTWKQKWLGKEPIFSGLSQTQRYTFGGFGHVAVATPVAIRNIVMATTSADIVSHSFDYEQEVSIGEPMRYDAKHTLVFNDSDLSSAQQSWLTHQTQNGTDGSIIDILRKNVEQGVPLPSLPEPANLTMHGEGQQWVAPPAASKAGIEKLGYADVDSDGVPIAKPANQLELKPGDYIEGMKGTRYIVIADPGSSFGVRYFKLTDPGTASGTKKAYTLGPIHDKDTGNQAYTGHQPFLGTESYDFQTELPFKKLAGHFDLTPSTKTVGGTQFVAGAWAQSGDQKFVKDLGVGGKFYFDGVPYEVEQVIGPKQVEVKSLASGKAGQINGVYKTNYLKLKEGYSEQGVPVFNPDDFFEGQPEKLEAMGLQVGDLFAAGQAGHLVWKVEATHEGNAPIEVVQVVGSDVGKKNIMALGLVGRKMTPKPPGWTPAEVGDTFAYQGKKATVTKLLKGGMVQANLAPGVVKLKPDDAALAGLFGASKHELGPKMKVKDMTPGQKFHGGTGGAIRPYVVVEMGVKKLQAAGTFARVRNLDNGDESLVGYQKSFKLLIPKGFAVSAEVKQAGDEGAGEVYNPAAWKPADSKIEIAQLKVGDKFLFPIGDQPMEITGDKGAAWEAKNLMTGAATPMLKGGLEVAPLVPSNVMPSVAFDPAQYVVGDEKKLADLQVGDIFKGTKGGKFYLVTKTGAKSGLSAVDLTTGKGSSPWAYTKVAPVMEQKAKGLKKHDELVPGDAAILAQLHEGDQFTIDGQLHQVVAPATAKDKNGTVAAVLPGGGLGFAGKVGYYPELLVTFHATAEAASAAAAKSEAEKVALTSVDTINPGDGGESSTDLEGLGWFGHEAFSPKSKTGGGYFFTKAKHADVGQVLVGKDGEKVIVKVAGADPVVSDGSSHWFLEGESNMKILDEPFDDHAPALTQSQDAVASQAAAVVPPMTTNAAGVTASELGLKPGDWVMYGGQALEIMNADPGPLGLWTAKAPGLGASYFGKENVPDAYAKKSEHLTAPDDGLPGDAGKPSLLSGAVNATTLEGFTKNTAAQPITEFPVGTVFTAVTAMPGIENSVWVVTGHPDNGFVPLTSVHPNGGETTSTTTSFIPGYVIVPPEPIWVDDFATADVPGMTTHSFITAQGKAQLASMGAVVDAVVQADLGDHWVKNDLVKLPTSMLLPGQLYKTANGNTWLWHGPKSGNDKFGFAELAAADVEGKGAQGDLFPIPMNFVPAEVGPTVDFHAEDWEPVMGPYGKKLMSTVQAGEVISLEGGKPMKVIDRDETNMKLVVAPTMPLSGKGQGAAHSLTIKSGLQAQLWQPKEQGYTATAIVAPQVAPGEKVLPSQLEVGDTFNSGQSGDGDAFNYKVLGITPIPGGVHLDITGVSSGDKSTYSQDWKDAEVTGKWTLVSKGAPTSSLEDAKKQGWGTNPDKLTVGQLPAGAMFVSGGAADVYTVKGTMAGAGEVIVKKNEGEGAPHESGPSMFGHPDFVPSQLWLPPPGPKGVTPGKHSETEAYMVQALIDAWHNHDENAYFNAENTIIQHLGIDVGALADEPADQHEDAEQMFDDFVKSVTAQHQLTAPGGAQPFDGGDPSAPAAAVPRTAGALQVGDTIKYDDAEWVVTAHIGDEAHITTLPSSGDVSTTLGHDETAFEQIGHIDGYLATSVASLAVGDEFEDSAHDKWEVTVKDSDGVIAVPIGGLGEDSAPFPDDETVTIITKASDFPGQFPTSREDVTVEAGSVPVGTYLQAAPSKQAIDKGETPAIWEVLGTENGLVQLAIAVPGKQQDGTPFALEKGAMHPNGVAPGSEWKIVDPALVAAGQTWKKGDKVLVDGMQHTVYEHPAGGVTVVNDATKEMTMVPAAQVMAAPKKGEQWKSPSSVVYEITSVKKGVPYGKQVFKSKFSDSVGYGSVTGLNMHPGGGDWSKLDSPITAGPDDENPIRTADEKGLKWVLGSSALMKAADMPIGSHAKSLDDSEFEIVGKNPLMLKAIHLTNDNNLHTPGAVFEHSSEWEPAAYALAGPKKKAPASVSLLGEPVTWNGEQGWVKFVTTDAQGSSKFGIGSTPGAAGASDIGVAPVTEVTTGHQGIGKASSDHPLKGYSPNSKSGGGYSFADLIDLHDGDYFTDKTGKVYVVQGDTVTSMVKIKAKDGSGAWIAPGTTRVKLVSA